MIRTSLRQQIDLRDEWLFRGDRASRNWLAGLGDEGRTVSLPHCWNETDTFQYGRHAHVGPGAYRRQIAMPDDGESNGLWRLKSEGFYGRGEVRLDGRRLDRFDAQYLGFSIDFPTLSAGEHQLAIRLDNRLRRHQLPGHTNPDFLLYGGLAGRVFLEWTPHFRIERPSITMKAAAGENVGVSIDLRAEIVNDGPADRSGRVSWRIFDDGNDPIAETEAAPFACLAGGGAHHVEATLEIPEPCLWSPEDPALYRVECRVEDESRAVDVVSFRSGLRTAEFRPGEGFFLNGSRLDLHGCNRHESIPGLGAALPPELQRADALLLKGLGANFVRLSHYPQHPTFLDACDELGLLVYPEIATWKSVHSSPRWRRAARRQMQDLVLRDRHRPCVILWGMGNESRSRKAYVELGDLVRTLDPQRPTIYAENHHYRARRQKTVGLPDVWGTNYELDVLEEAAASSRLGNVVLSECCNHPHSVKGDEAEELKQLEVLEREWEAMRDRPYLAGYAVWCLTDYATEHRDRFRRLAGLCDAWRRPKMAAELFRARHATVPFTALFVTAPSEARPASSFRREISHAEGAPPKNELHVFTNCPSIRIRVDGSEVGEFDGAFHYVLGLHQSCKEIRVSAVADDREVVEVWRPHGPAADVEISAVLNAFSSGRTVAVDLRVVDEDDLQVESWNSPLRLEIQGPARLRSYTPSDEVLMARGEGRIYVTCAPQETGTVVINAIGGDLVARSEFSWK